MSETETPNLPVPRLPDLPGVRRERKKGPKLNERERETREKLILARKIAGDSVAQIQKAFNISRATVYRGLGAARKKGLYDAAGDMLADRLMPKALEVLMIELEAGNAEVAMEVVKGLGLLGSKQHMVVSTAPPAEETFELYRARVTRTYASPADTGNPGFIPAGELGPGDVLDADLAAARDEAADPLGAAADDLLVDPTGQFAAEDAADGDAELGGADL